MQFQQCQKQEIMSSIKYQHYDVTSCTQRHLIENIIGDKGYQPATTTDNSEKLVDYLLVQADKSRYDYYIEIAGNVMQTA